MLFWFLATAVAAVWFVFRDDRFDYRLLLVGAILPDVIDIPMGQARWAHSLTCAVVLLVVVMLTTGRRPIRRLFLGLPIGVLLHLVFDGAFSMTKVFWWPFSGSWGDSQVPSLARGWWDVAFEVAGLALGVWLWRQFRLSDPSARQRFRETGQLHARSD